MDGKKQKNVERSRKNKYNKKKKCWKYQGLIKTEVVLKYEG